MLAAVIAVGIFFAVLFAMYGATRWVSSGEVMGRVDIAEQELGGKTQDEALNTVSAIEIARLGRIANFEVDGQVVELEPGSTGLQIDEESIVAEAMAIGREGNFANQFLFWLTNIFTTHQIELEGTVDAGAVDEIFTEWETEVIAKPIVAGGIELSEEGEPVAIYPQTGVGIDRESSVPIVLETLLATEAEIALIPTTVVNPALTTADVDAALFEAQQLLAAPITMAASGESAVLTVDMLTEAFVSETITNSPATIVNSFDHEVIDRYLAPVRSQFEAEPVDAQFVIEGNTVRVQPGAKGTRIDETETAERLFRAGLTEARTGTLPIVEGSDPDITTEYLEGLNVKHLVSEFTTYHDCCEPRVTNIQLMADAIDGVLVVPGETFSINGHVGERTEAKGYLPAGSIVAGEITDTIGGGVSQFATTFYNAVFWGGYQDITHQPHSYYFSRYPEGVEATLFWRSIDLAFRNNREHAILIDTRYTDNSITVRFYGFNHGRTLSGEQRGGNTSIRVVSEGGPEALHVKGQTSERHSPTEPGEPRYKANPELGVDQTVQTQSARDGWSVTITRRILEGGTDLVEEQEWVVRYRAQFEVFEVHPCKVPGTSTACPTTTTTTLPPTTTTTLPPTTTSTPDP